MSVRIRLAERTRRRPTSIAANRVGDSVSDSNLYQDLGADDTEAYVTWMNDLLEQVGTPKEGREFAINDDGRSGGYCST
jgi:hypothetical protein